MKKKKSREGKKVSLPSFLGSRIRNWLEQRELQYCRDIIFHTIIFLLRSRLVLLQFNKDTFSHICEIAVHASGIPFCHGIFLRYYDSSARKLFPSVNKLAITVVEACQRKSCRLLLMSISVDQTGHCFAAAALAVRAEDRKIRRLKDAVSFFLSLFLNVSLPPSPTAC